MGRHPQTGGQLRQIHTLAVPLAAMASRAPALLRPSPGAALRCRPPSPLPSRCRVPPSLLLRCRVPPLLSSPRRLWRSAAAPVPVVRAAASPPSPSASVEEEDDVPNLPCGTCNSKGWLLCDFCEGQKTNVQVRANKFYRRCPSCRAVGVVICPQCKVFKCVTFPDGVDGY